MISNGEMLRERIRQALEAGVGDDEFEPRLFAHDYVQAIGAADPSDPLYQHAVRDIQRDVRYVIKHVQENGIPKWMWTGRGSVFQRAAAMSLATIESLEYRNEATIEGFLRRRRMLRAMHLIKEGVEAAEAAATAEAEFQSALEALA